MVAETITPRWREYRQMFRRYEKATQDEFGQPNYRLDRHSKREWMVDYDFIGAVARNFASYIFGGVDGS